MELKEVTDKLVSIHREYQKLGGYDDSDSVSAKSCPLTDLNGFDSDFIPEIVRRLAKELGRPFADGTRVKNIYVSEDRKKKLTIKEIGRRFIKMYVSSKKGVTV